MSKFLVHFILLSVICIEMTLCFIGGGPGKRSSDANRLYQQQQQPRQEQEQQLQQPEKVSIFFFLKTL